MVLPTAASAIQEQQQKVESRSQTPKPGASRPPLAVPTPATLPGHGGHSVVAKRATSPKVPKPKMSRGNSPLGGQPPVGSSPATHEAVHGTGLKRKADNPSNSPSGSTSETPKHKKRKPAVQGTVMSSAELEAMLLEWLKTTTNASTRDCIQYFTPYLVDAEKKTEFSAMVRKHATLKNGVLVSRAAP